MSSLTDFYASYPIPEVCSGCDIEVTFSNGLQEHASVPVRRNWNDTIMLKYPTAFGKVDKITILSRNSFDPVIDDIEDVQFD